MTIIYCVICSGRYAVPAEGGGGTTGKTIIVAARNTEEEAQKVCAEWPNEQDTPWSVDAMWVQPVELDCVARYDL
jgi:hypothetical protein